MPRACLEDQLGGGGPLERQPRRDADLDLSALHRRPHHRARTGHHMIDVAYRYFATPRRRFIIADNPGHEQYTRNMVTGSSTADLAIRDPRRRHARHHAADAPPCSRRVTTRHSARHVVAVNKMDQVAWNRTVYEEIGADFAAISRVAGPRGRRSLIPMSALEGDMVVRRGDHLDWYEGPTLLPRGPRGGAGDFEIGAALAPSRCNSYRAHASAGRASIAAISGASSPERIKVGDTVLAWPHGVTKRA